MRGIQSNTMIFDALRATGALLFFPKGPKGALTHHPEGAVVFPAETVRSPRGLRLLREPMDNATSPLCCCHCPRSYRKHILFCVCAQGYKLYPTLRQLPAKTCHRQLCRRCGDRFICGTHFLFTKKKQKQERRTVRTNGNLPSGSKSGQPGQRPICCCCIRISELLQNFE